MRRLFTAAVPARLASEMWPVAAVLLILDRTGSATLAGLSMACLTLPSLVTGPLLVARGRLRALLAVDQIVAAAALAAMAAMAGRVPGALLLLPPLVAGITFPMSTAGFSALVPSVTPPERLPEANALDAGTYNVSQVTGPAVAAGLIALGGPIAALAVQAVLKLAALLACLRLPEAAGADQRGGVGPGLRAVRAERPLLDTTVSGTVALAGRGFLAVGFPVFAMDRLDAGEGATGLLWASLAVGGIAGTIAAPALQRRISASALVLGGYAASGAVMALWLISGTLAAALVVGVLAGLCAGPALTATYAVRQAHTPAGLLGQVSMTGASTKIAGFALGAAAGGPVTSAGGWTAALGAAAGLHLLAGVPGLVPGRRVPRHAH